MIIYQSKLGIKVVGKGHEYNEKIEREYGKRNHDAIQIYAGYAIPKVLTDLVRWKGGEQNE